MDAGREGLYEALERARATQEGLLWALETFCLCALNGVCYSRCQARGVCRRARELPKVDSLEFLFSGPTSRFAGPGPRK